MGGRLFVLVLFHVWMASASVSLKIVSLPFAREVSMTESRRYDGTTTCFCSFLLMFSLSGCTQCWVPSCFARTRRHFG